MTRTWGNAARVALMSAFVLVSGCGGGGGGNAPAPSPTPAPGSFTVTATVAGVPAQGFAVSSGGNGTLNVQTGQSVQFSASGPVTWSVASTGVGVVAGSSNATAWSGAFGSDTARTVTITATSTVDTSRIASVSVNVAAGPTFALPAPAVGGALTMVVNDTLNDNSTRASSYTDTTTAVNTDGSYVVQRTVGGVLSRTINNTADGSRSSQLLTNGNLCSYTPARVYFAYPLYFGKSWSSSWVYQCAFGYRESAALTGQVISRESVTVPAGTFDALRVLVVIQFSGSNDANLTGGSTSTAQYRIESTCWFGTAPVLFLGCDDQYTYTGTAPATYLKTNSYKRATL